MTSVTIIRFGLGHLIYQYFNIYFILNLKRTTCACTNEIKTDLANDDAEAEYRPVSNCASSCNSGNDAYCGTTGYDAIYQISNSTTGIVC